MPKDPQPNDEAGDEPLSYASESTPGRRKHWLLTLNVILGAIAIALVSISIVPPLVRRLTRSNWANSVPCASNLRQIGTAMMMYANSNGGAYPDSFATMLRNEDITPDTLICPSSNDMRSSAPTTEELYADLDRPGHVSYIYAARRLTSSAPPATVLAYEPLINHRGAGIHVLFGDGHVDWVTGKDAKWVVSEVSIGFNPPRPAQ